MSTSAERTARVPQENRTVYILTSSNYFDRVVRVEQQNRTVFVESRANTSEARTVYATED